DSINEIIWRHARGFERREKFVVPLKPPVRHFDERPGRDGASAKFQRIAKRSVRVWKCVKQVRVLVVGTARDDASIAGQDLELAERFMHETESERRCLDADARCRTVERDRPQL